MQTCVSANRIFVHESLHDTVVKRLESKVSQLVLGDGSLPETTQGPLINEKAAEKVTFVYFRYIFINIFSCILKL